MSLSAGTLNLKFMQRAAAKAGAAPASKPSSSAASPAPAASTPAPAASAPASAPSTPQPAAEEEGKWSLPRRSAPAAAGPSRRVQVSFVSSYLPFMEDAPAMTHGGGRRAFGGFGDQPEPEKEEEESDEEDVDAVLGSDGEMEDVVKTRKSKEKGKDKDKAKAKVETTSPKKDAPRTFLRPAGFEPAKTTKPASTQVRTSQADKLRQTIAGMKSVSVTPSASAPSSGTSTPQPTSVSGKKRAHPPASDDEKPKRPRSSNEGAAETKKMTLDEREKALKAAKKAQKKKKKAN